MLSGRSWSPRTYHSGQYYNHFCHQQSSTNISSSSSNATRVWCGHRSGVSHSPWLCESDRNVADEQSTSGSSICNHSSIIRSTNRDSCNKASKLCYNHHQHHHRNTTIITSNNTNDSHDNDCKGSTATISDTSSEGWSEMRSSAGSKWSWSLDDEDAGVETGVDESFVCDKEGSSESDAVVMSLPSSHRPNEGEDLCSLASPRCFLSKALPKAGSYSSWPTRQTLKACISAATSASNGISHDHRSVIFIHSCSVQRKYSKPERVYRTALRY